MTTHSLPRRRCLLEGGSVFRRGDASHLQATQSLSFHSPLSRPAASGGVVEAARDPSHHYSGCLPSVPLRAVPFNFMRRRRAHFRLAHSRVQRVIRAHGVALGIVGRLALRRRTSRQHARSCRRVSRSSAAASGGALRSVDAPAHATRRRHAAWPSTSTTPFGPAPPPPAFFASSGPC